MSIFTEEELDKLISQVKNTDYKPYTLILTKGEKTIMEEIIMGFSLEESNSVKAISINDLDFFSLYHYPTEEEMKLAYSMGFTLKKIVPKNDCTKYIFTKNDLMEVL